MHGRLLTLVWVVGPAVTEGRVARAARAARAARLADTRVRACV